MSCAPAPTRSPRRRWPDYAASALPARGPAPSEPVRAQRRASATGVIVVCGQKIALGRTHAGQTLTAAVSETTLAIELDDAETRAVRPTTSA